MTDITPESPFEAPHDMTAEANGDISRAYLLKWALSHGLSYFHPTSESVAEDLEHTNTEVSEPIELPVTDEPLSDHLPHAS